MLDAEEVWYREGIGCAHLHSVRGRRGRSLYHRGIGSFQQSWRRNGRRCGQRSTRRCLRARRHTHSEKTPQMMKNGTSLSSFGVAVCCGWLCAEHYDAEKNSFWKEDVSCLLPAAVVNLLAYILSPFWGTEIEFSIALWNNKLPQQESKQSLLFVW